MNRHYLGTTGALDQMTKVIVTPAIEVGDRLLMTRYDHDTDTMRMIEVEVTPDNIEAIKAFAPKEAP
jgi:hypothetical protein